MSDAATDIRKAMREAWEQDAEIAEFIAYSLIPYSRIGGMIGKVGGKLINVVGKTGGRALKPATNVGVAVSEEVAYASSKLLSWGNTAKGHLIKHADALGFNGYTPQQLQKMLPQLRGAANQLYNNINPALTRIGRWGGQADDIFRYITNNGKMLVTKQNGEFITVINKTSNNWYQLAKNL